jgi:AcrR family transcriptional regulator
MREEGYAAVTSRKVAQKAGLKSHLLHYYYRTMEELFVAVWLRYDDRFLERQASVLASNRPLWELWKISVHTADTTLRQEFISLANHRKAIRALIARSARRNRNIQVAGINQHFKQRRIGSKEYTPMMLVLLFAFVSRSMITEQNLGVSDHHAEIVGFIEQKIRSIESKSHERKRGAVELGKLT